MLELYCTVCRGPLSPELIRKNACTCGPECKKALTRIRRALKKSGHSCPTCGQTVRQGQSARVREVLGATVQKPGLPNENALQVDRALQGVRPEVP